MEKSNWPVKGIWHQIKNSELPNPTNLTHCMLQEFLNDLASRPYKEPEKPSPYRPMDAKECQENFGKFIKKMPESHLILTENNFMVRYMIHDKKVYYYLQYSIMPEQ